MRQIIFWSNIFTERVVPDVANNSHDLAWNVLSVPSYSGDNPLADRIFIGEKPARECFIDNCDPRRVIYIPGSEVAPIEHGNAHGLEIPWARYTKGRGRLIRLRHRPTLNLK